MVHEYLAGYELVLGSRSPRRELLLRQLGLKPIILTTDIEENSDIEDPDEQVFHNARLKMNEIKNRLKPRSVAITADTIVVHKDRILGKPGSPEEASTQLQLLSGENHFVKTGLSLFVTDSGKERTDIVTSKVRFKVLNEKEIKSYIDTREPLDKAGSYGIQGYAAQFVESIEGCYFNVVGLPIAKLYDMLKGVFDGN